MQKELILLPTCHSTNDEATHLANQGCIEGTWVITYNQTKGRGQRGTIWESEPNKNIAASLVLRPTQLPIGRQFDLHICTSLAICHFIDRETGLKPTIKWPNDIYIENKKTAGVLLESSVVGKRWEYIIIGLGLNVNQSHFHTPSATSLFIESGQRLEPLHEVADKLSDEVLYQYEKMMVQKVDLKPYYLQYLYRYQEKATFYDRREGLDFEGEIVGVGQDGRLAVLCNGTTKHYDIKEIQFL